MPPLPGTTVGSSKNIHIPSTSATAHQNHSPTSLTISSNFSSPPHSIPDTHVERGRSRAAAGVGGSMTGEDSRDGRSGRVPQSSSGSYGGSYGRSQGLRSKKGGGGFLLGMGGRNGTNFSLNLVERDGLRSASDPQPPAHNFYADQYPRTGAASSSLNFQRRSVEHNVSEREKTDIMGLVGGTNDTMNSETSRLDGIFPDDGDVAARIVKLAEGSSENRKSLYGGRVQATQESIDLAVGRRLSSGSRGASSRPFLTLAAPQGVPIEPRRRVRTPSTALSPEHLRFQTFQASHTHPESPQLYAIEAQSLDHQKWYQTQTQVPSPLRLAQPLSSAFPFQPQQSRTLPFNQVQIPYLKLNPSASTLARAAKARQYLDLFTRYIDLLGSLPPAKDIPNLPHSQLQQSHHHHCTNQQLVPSQHPLRKYNPLQTIRNRRLRNRQGLGQLDLTPWEDPAVVESWVDATINAFTNATLQGAQGPQNYFTIQRQSHLPTPPHPRLLEKGKSKPKRSKLDWVVHPSEMFADFYWMNECAGKNVMEDRFGGRIFRKGSTSTLGSNNSTPSSVGARGSMEKARVSGHGKTSQEEPNALRWSMEHGERGSKNLSGIVKGDNQDFHVPSRRDRSFSLTRDGQATKADYGGGGMERLRDMPSYEHPGVAGELSLPAGPGITIGIGGGYVSPDDSPYDEESEGDFHDEKKGGRASMESRRYSSLIEDEVVSGDIPLRRTFFENPDKMGIENTVTRKRHHHHHHHHHHHLYRFGHHHRQTKGGEAEDSSASSLDLLAINSSDSEASESRKRDRKWIIKRRRHNKAAKVNNSTEMDGSAEEDLTADGGENEESRIQKSSPLIKKLKQQTRREKHSSIKHQPIGDSDYDTNYESAAAISRSPSPAVTPYKNTVPRSSLDHDTKTLDFAQVPSLQSRTTLAPPPPDRKSKNLEQNTGNLNASPYLVASSPGKTPGEERGRERKDSKDDGLGVLLKRAISPMKLSRRSGDYIRDDDLKDFERRDSKDSERDILPSLERDKGKDKKSRAKDTVKKAAEKVGNRVERIKNGVGGLVWGKEAPQSAPTSNYASSMGSAGGISEKEDSDQDIRENCKLSVDLDSILRIQKKKSKHGHVKQLSAANLGHLDIDPGTATPSDASLDGDDDEFGRRGLFHKNDELPKLDIPKLKIMGPSREHSPVVRRSGSGLVEARSYEKLRPGGVRLRREKSRLGEEFKGDSDSPAIERGSVLAPLGRIILPPVAAMPRRGTAHVATVRRGYIGKKDIARTRALMLSTGILARGMASQTQTLEQQKAVPEFMGTLQLTTYHHIISAKHLSSQIHSSAQDLDSKIIAFRTATLAHLRNQILGIQDEVSAKLTPLVQTTADDADVLSGELSTKYVLEVKRLNDEVSTLARRRRRTTLKWVRRGGYVLLEWVVLGVMWWVWLIVVMVRMVRVVVGGIGRGLKWMVLWK